MTVRPLPVGLLYLVEKHKPCIRKRGAQSEWYVTPFRERPQSSAGWGLQARLVNNLQSPPTFPQRLTLPDTTEHSPSAQRKSGRAPNCLFTGYGLSTTPVICVGEVLSSGSEGRLVIWESGVRGGHASGPGARRVSDDMVGAEVEGRVGEWALCLQSC